MTRERWVWCTDCGHNARTELSLPASIHCADCGRLLGELTDPITCPETKTTFSADKQAIVHSDTGAEHSRIDWNTTRVTIHDGADSQ